jgi:hypothetical protein
LVLRGDIWFLKLDGQGVGSGKWMAESALHGTTGIRFYETERFPMRLPGQDLAGLPKLVILVSHETIKFQAWSGVAEDRTQSFTNV